MSGGPLELRVLHVEDDDFQRQNMQAMLEVVGDKYRSLRMTIVHAVDCQMALEVSKTAPFDLVLMDYQLPSGDSGSILPTIRSSVGSMASICIISGAAQEEELQRCWLDLGADSYRLKPLSVDAVHKVVEYTLRKRGFLQKRGRSMSRSPAHSRRASSDSSSTSPARDAKRTKGKRAEDSPDLPGFVTFIANGRRGPIHLGFLVDAPPCAVKVMDARLVRGAAPPSHPNVNPIHRRLFRGDRCIEIRELCDGGLFFDTLSSWHTDDAFYVEWFGKLVDAVAHCHAHGAVHGQLRADNVLLYEDGERHDLQVVGFEGCFPCSPASVTTSRVHSQGRVERASGRDAGSLGGSPRSTSGQAEPIKLRADRPDRPGMDAPELHGRTTALPRELAASDVWALGMLLTHLLTGTDPARPSSSPYEAGVRGDGSERGQRGEGGGGSRGNVNLAAILEDLVVSMVRGSGQFNPTLRELVDLGCKMLQLDPKARPSASEVQAHLQQLRSNLSWTSAGAASASSLDSLAPNLTSEATEPPIDSTTIERLQLT